MPNVFSSNKLSDHYVMGVLESGLVNLMGKALVNPPSPWLNSLILILLQSQMYNNDLNNLPYEQRESEEKCSELLKSHGVSVLSGIGTTIVISLLETTPIGSAGAVVIMLAAGYAYETKAEAVKEKVKDYASSFYNKISFWDRHKNQEPQQHLEMASSNSKKFK